jgi:hypothetical protein
MARQGKISRLPHALRESVNLRLHDGQSAGVILAWLNAQKDAMRTWDAYFEGEAATPQNLSAWRAGGYAEWAGRKERTENLKTLSSFALDLTKSGGNIADGAASILAGQILEALEQSANFVVTGGSDDAENDPAAGLAKMASAVASLQSSGVARSRLELDKRKVAQKDQALALDREKFERQTVRKFLEWAKSTEAVAILDSGKPKHVQMDKLRELMFGKVTGHGSRVMSKDASDPTPLHP